MNNSADSKQCRKCKELINKKAKKCPHCGAKQGLPIWVFLIIGLVAFSIGFRDGVNDTSSEDSSNNSSSSSSLSNNSETNNIEYIKLSKDDLDEALKNNAATAKSTYNKKYVEVTGKLGTIDSDLKYISLNSLTEEWDLMGIHCTVKNNAQKEIIKTLTKDQEITIRGKITDVGEVLGYYLDITEIVVN